MNLTIRPLTPSDRMPWQTLWTAYLAFYKTTLPPEQFDLTWLRLHDANEPMHVLGAFEGNTPLGIVHFIFHRSCWTAAPYCYLQDLFTVAEARGKGVGRALIEAVYVAAKAEGANRVHWLTHESNAKAMVLYNDVAERTGFLQYRKIL
jgi:GNAT superfamily N-acetyltransferase